MIPKKCLLGFLFGTALTATVGSGLGCDLAEPEGTTGSVDRVALLRSASTWMYQIQQLDASGAINALAATNYPLLVLEPTYTNVGQEGFDVEGMIRSLRTRSDGSHRLLIAYIDIGEAEDYRTYWGSDWVAPMATKRGSPDFLITIDPDGWSGNYPVAFWDARWQGLWLGENGLVAKLAKLGFDGVYLDWVEAYDNTQVKSKAVEDGVHTADAMTEFISQIRQAGRRVTSDFLVIAQNAPYLIDESTKDYASVIDALAMEDTWFRGEGDSEWEDAGAGDIPNDDTNEFSTEGRLTQYQKYSTRGLPVFTVDYCIAKTNAEQVYRDSRARGLIPLATRVSLSRVTETPPP